MGKYNQRKNGVYWSQLAKNALKLSTLVGEIFGIYSSQRMCYSETKPDHRAHYGHEIWGVGKTGWVQRRKTL